MKFAISTLFALIISCMSIAQTTLTDGDVVITRMNRDGADDFSFVFLTSVTSGTTFFITDETWNGSSFTSYESTYKFTATTNISAGEEVHVFWSGTAMSMTTTSGNSLGTLTDLGAFTQMSFSSGGDNLYIFQGSVASPTFVSGLMSEDGDVGTSGNAWSNTKGLIPAGKTNGVGGYFGLFPNGGGTSETDNVRYKTNELHVGDKATVLAEIMDPDNWEKNNTSTYSASTAVFNISAAAVPVSATITAQTNVSCPGGSNGSLTVTANDGTANYDYQWSNFSSTLNTSSTTNTITNLAATTYTVTITDDNGNTATASATLTAAPDNTDPVISVCVSTPSNITANAWCQGTAPDLTGGVTATDNCTGSPTITQSPGAGATLGLGTTTITLTATDGSGNTATCTVNQTVVDNTAPIITVCASTPSNIPATSFCTGTAPDLTGSVTATDNCTGSPVITQSPTAGATLGLGTTTITLTAWDGSGNTATCTVNQTVVDNTAPTITVCASTPSNIAANGSCQGTTPNLTGSVTATDNCTGSPVITQSPVAGATLGLGTTTITLTATDGSGNTATCTVNQTVVDNTAPIITVCSSTPSNLVANSSNIAAASDLTGGVTATDNCTGSPVITQSPAAGATLGLGTTTITLTATDGSGNTATCTVNQTVIQNFSANITAQTNVDCNGNSNGLATATGVNGTTPYAYLWSNGVTTATANGLAAGSYTVTVTDNNGVTAMTSVTITQPATITALAVVDSNVTCNSYSDGGATSAATGGTTPYSYQWSNGAITASITGVPAAMYNVTITDANGCFDDASATITEPVQLTAATYVDSNVTCNGLADGGTTAFGTGGTGAYLYAWSNAATTASIANIYAGTYSVTVTDGVGCTDSASVTVTEPATFIASTVVDSNVSCNGLADGGVSASHSGGTTPVNYFWGNSATTASITGLTAGTYSVMVIDAKGCSSFTTATVTEPATLSSNVVIDSNVSCNGFTNGGASVISNGGTAPYTHMWNIAATTVSVTGIGAGMYTVTVTDANGCTAMDSATITQPAALSFPIMVDANVTCNSGANGALSLSGSQPVVMYFEGFENYTGSGTHTADTVLAGLSGVVFNTSTSQGRLRVPAGANYVRTGNFSATMDATISGASPDPENFITTTFDMSGMTGSAVTLDFWFMDHGEETDANDRTWIRGDDTSPWIEVYNFVSPNLSNGVWHNVVVSNLDSILSANGQSFTATFGVRFGQQDNFPSSSITASDGITIDDISIVVGGGAGLSFAWSTGDTTSAVSGLAAGTYTVTVTNATGCSVVETATVTEPTLLVSTAVVDTNITCGNVQNGAASVIAMGGTPGYAYAWSNGATTASITGLMAGMYTVTVTDTNMCSTIDTVTILELDSTISVLATQDITVYLDANGEVVINALQIDNGTLDSCGIVSMTINDSVFTCNNVGANNVIFTAVDGSGNMASDTVVVTVMDTNTQILFGSYTMMESTCYGDDNAKILTSTHGGSVPYAYAWSNGSNFTNLSNLTPGQYMVTVTDANGCTQIDSVTVTEPGELKANIEAISPLCFGGNDGSLVSHTTGGTMPYSFMWNTGNTSDSLSGLFAATYEVTITDDRNCQVVESFDLLQPAQINVTVSTVNVLCSADQNGLASAVASGGVGQLSYLWEDGTTINSVSGLGKGSYQITVTDTNMCEVISTFFVGSDFESPVVDLGPDETITWQENFTFDAENTGASYVWSTGDSSQIVDVFVTADTTIWVNVTGEGGCVTSDTITIMLDEVIGIKELNLNKVNVYPNPTMGETQLLVGASNAQTMKVRVLDVTGALLWTKHVDSPQKGDVLSIDLSKYSIGMYFITVQMDEEQILFKVNKL